MRIVLSKAKHRKFDQIKQNFIERNNLRIGENWFVSYTDVEFPFKFKWLLSLGKRFTLPIHQENFPLFATICDVEECLKNIEDEKERDIVRARVTHILTSNNLNKNNFNDTHHDDVVLRKFIIKTHDECQKFLKCHKDIIVVQADKGGATVIITSNEYKTKMNVLLNDPLTYTIHPYAATH